MSAGCALPGQAKRQRQTNRIDQEEFATKVREQRAKKDKIMREAAAKLQ